MRCGIGVLMHNQRGPRAGENKNATDDQLIRGVFHSVALTAPKRLCAA
jgi:hypothetical protein